MVRQPLRNQQIEFDIERCVDSAQRDGMSIRDFLSHVSDIWLANLSNKQVSDRAEIKLMLEIK